MVESLRVGDGFTGFDNVCFNPLLVNDLGDALLDLMARGLEGTVHVAASDSCSKYDFGIQVAQLFGCDARLIQKGRYSEESTGARRPLAPILSVDYAQRLLGRTLPKVAEGLARFKSMQDNGSVRDIRSMVGNTRDGK